jgi:hypothetical protein
MEAANRAGARWEHIRMNFCDETETDEFSTPYHLAHGLEMLRP